MRAIPLFLTLLLLTGQAVAFTGVPEKYKATKELADLPGMAIEGRKYMIGADEVKGINGVAYLNDLGQNMARYGLNSTHHLMVELRDNASGALIDLGSVAVKITPPDGETGSAIRLLPMTGGFGADVTLKQKGSYRFTVGTELRDGEKRIFSFDFENR